MKSRFLFLICLFVLFVPLRPATVLAAPADQVLRATLDNGLRVVIVRNDLAPVVTTQLNYLAGSDEAPAGFPGMAHAQEHMMFRGTAGLSADQLANIIAAMGGEFNAETQQTITQYYFTVPADDLKVALHIEALRMADVLDSEALWDKERGAIEQEVAQDLSNPEYRFYTQLLQKMYAGTPYAHDALGSKDSFDRTTGAMLHNFHRNWYAPNNAILVIVGGVEPQATLALVKELFGGIASRPLPPRPEVKLAPLQPAAIRLQTDRPYGMAVVAYRLPGYASPDYAAGQVLADVLASQRGDLYALVPEGAALYAGFSADPLPQACTGYALAAFPPGGDGAALVKRMQAIVAGYLQERLPRRTGGRRQAPGDRRRRICPHLHSRPGRRLVPGGGGGGAPVARRRLGGDLPRHPGRRRPGRPCLARQRPGGDRGPYPAALGPADRRQGLRRRRVLRADFDQTRRPPGLGQGCRRQRRNPADQASDHRKRAAQRPAADRPALDHQ